MKPSEVVRAIMKIQGVGPSRVAARLNKTPRFVTDRLRLENISIDKLNELFRVLDYKIVALPREARVPDAGYEID